VTTTSPASSAVLLKWRVFEEPKGSIHRLELSTSIDGVEKVTALASVNQLDPWIYNSFCDGSVTLEGNQLSKVTVPQSSERGYVVRRSKPDLMTLFGWSKDADPCVTSQGPGTCPTTEKSIAAFPIREGVTVSQRFVVVAKSGTETILRCKEMSDPAPRSSKPVSLKARDAGAP
jgi:hypothetical protein